MVSQKVRKICEDIKALRIQGARNIAIAAVRALNIQAQESDARNSSEFYADLLEAADALAGARPTEPMLRNSLRNAIRFILLQIRKKGEVQVHELKKLMEEEERNYERNVERNARRIWEFGAKEIPKGACVLTHCHSSTVIGILKRAQEMGKNISAICTETRPKFQGRITAKELRDAGIPVVFIVDSAVGTFIQDADLVLVGADAITASGDLVNKIGTCMIAQLARAHGLKFFSAAELHKFDPLTLWGRSEEIEEREPSEIADPKEFEGIKIRNPAFDLTPARLVSAYITELGIIPPQSLLSIAAKEFRIEEPPM